MIQVAVLLAAAANRGSDVRPVTTIVEGGGRLPPVREVVERPHLIVDVGDIRNSRVDHRDAHAAARQRGECAAADIVSHRVEGHE